MDERRKWKNVNTEVGRNEYRRMNNLLRRETDQAMELWLIQQCQDIEELEREGKISTAKRNSQGQQVLEDAHDKLLTDDGDIKIRWKQYIEDLYSKKERPDNVSLEEEAHANADDLGLELLERE